MSNPPVISVVDDHASVRVGTENLLNSLGYTVHTFASAEEFLRSAHFSDTSKLPQICSSVDAAIVFRHLQGVVHSRIIMKLIFDGGERGLCLRVG